MLDGSILFAIFEVQILDSIGRPDPCVILNHLGVYLAVALRAKKTNTNSESQSIMH